MSHCDVTQRSIAGFFASVITNTKGLFVWDKIFYSGNGAKLSESLLPSLRFMLFELATNNDGAATE